jgi:hypothetical protein
MRFSTGMCGGANATGAQFSALPSSKKYGIAMKG